MAKPSRYSVPAEDAQAELAFRELARTHLVEYGQYIYDWWTPARAHELICEELEDVYRYIESGGMEGTQALIIEIPPQHGKSTIVSRLFPSYVLGRRPDTRIMLATYAADFSADHSKEVREIISGARFAALFGEKSKSIQPVELSGDSFARGNWSIEKPHRGGMIAVGVEGGVTGRPAELFIIDDPFKSREEADSPVERRKRKRWMTSSVLSRVKKNTAIVMIHTRWHREDLIGEMIRAQATEPKAMKWRVLSLPAVPLELEEYATSVEDQQKVALQGLYKPLADPLGRTPGSFEPLWPELFDQVLLKQIQSTLMANGELGDWFSLYMQQPRPSDGIFFGDAMFQIIEPGQVTDGLHWYGYMDLALGETSGSDWNAVMPVAYGPNNDLYARDMIHIHDLDEFLDVVMRQMTSPMEKQTTWGVEAVAFQKLVFKRLVEDTRLRGISIEPITVEKSKVDRARPVRSLGLAKKIFLVRGPWIQSFLLEAMDFPTGRHDDQVDTLSGGLAMAAGAGMRPEPKDLVAFV